MIGGGKRRSGNEISSQGDNRGDQVSNGGAEREIKTYFTTAEYPKDQLLSPTAL